MKNIIRIGICDDDATQYDCLKKFIHNFFCDMENIKVSINAYDSGEKLIKDHKSQKFHLIFLDIEMAQMNGIDIGSEIRKYDIKVQIIYVTGYDISARAIIKIKPLDYFVKPIKYAEFFRVMNEFLNNFFETETLEPFPLDENKTIYIKSRKRKDEFVENDIIAFERSGNTVIVRCIGEKDKYLYISLKDLLGQIDQSKFVRCHSGFVVNTLKIIALTNHEVTMIDNTKCPIGRVFKDSFLNRFYRIERKV